MAFKKSLKNFLGMFPRYQPYLLNDMASQLLVDGNILSGGLEAFRQDSVEYMLENLTTDMYKYVSDDYIKWLLFDTEVDIARSAVIDDINNQTFITGINGLRVFDKESLKSDESLHTIASNNSYKAGLSLPSAPTLSVVDASTSSSNVSRAYCIAYMREWRGSGKQDLGPASLPATTSSGQTYIDVPTGKQVKITNIFKDPNDEEHATHIIIYRAATGTDGTGTWREVIRFGTTLGSVLPYQVTYESSTGAYTFLDDILDEDLGEVPSNFDWGCPDGLEGLVSLKNGVFAAFVKNTVYLSVPYQGHAWPSTYAIPLDYDVIGLGCFGNTLVICTTVSTFLCTVSDPSSTILVPLHEASTCASKKSIVSLGESVIYATSYGLVQVTGNGINKITDSIITEKEWRYYNPSSIKAAAWQGKYLMFFDSDTVEYSGLVVDFNNLRLGLHGLSQRVSCIRPDDNSDDIFIQYVHPVLLAPRILSFATSNSLKRVYRWTSKKFLNNEGLFTISAGKINFYNDSYEIKRKTFDFSPDSHAFNTTPVNLYPINGDASSNDYVLANLSDEWCQLSYYVDDVIKKTILVNKNFPFRLPAGFRGDSFYVDIVSTEPIARVQLASSIGELE